jgi:BirA family biotin operon repressor/biotin-[acetyl-CoA-carboxylase] ligase
MKEKILSYLRNAQGYVSGQELCETLGVSRTAIWKNIKILQQEGYEIHAVKNRGYRLLCTPDALTRQEIAGNLHTKWLGKELYCAESVDSTNNWVKRLAEEGAAHGTVAVADEQTQGKGRRGRQWVTPKGTAIAVSKLLRPKDLPPERASMLTLVEGLSIAQAVHQLYDLDTAIKWPNDVVVSRKKICGILTEMSAEVDYINYIVIGTGINANMEEFPPDLQDKATSLKLELGQPVKRALLLAKVMEVFEHNYEIFQKTWDLSGLIQDYNRILVNFDNQVKVMEPGNEYTGIARGIDKMGQLIVESEDGTITKVYAGEVSVRGLYGYV